MHEILDFKTFLRIRNTETSYKWKEEEEEKAQNGPYF
jgi:hypothetical protein